MIELNENWKLTWSSLGYDASRVWQIARQEEGWLECSLPCDIHTPLIENGVIQEPTIGLNFFACEWTEKKAWWFRKVFDIDVNLLEDQVALIIDNIDCNGDIFLNGAHLGYHANTFYPFVKDIKKIVQEKGNELIIRVTAGLERVSEFDCESVSKNIGMLLGYNRGDARRIMVRKPQYGFGWDWCPRIPTCGLGYVGIDTYSRAVVKDVYVKTEAINRMNEAQLAIEIVLENPDPIRTTELDLEIEILEEQEVVFSERQNVLLCSGVNYLNMRTILANAKLWWPHGYGKQIRYEIQVKCIHNGAVPSKYAGKFGIRTVEIDLSKINDSERKFGLVINGKKIFVKGGNWVPADSLYLRVPDRSYRSLIEEAVEANLNLLRIWGGGLYEKKLFYELCDEKGIMVWQDLMFACALYPDQNEVFRNEVCKELDYQTRRLRRHPSMVLWCGNNENQMVYDLFFEGDSKHWEFAGGTIFNQIAPEIIHRNCPDIPYWNGSPYGGENPNGTMVGDSHEWFISAFAKQFEDKITPEVYDHISAKFVSEFGHVGPSKLSSVKKYHGDETIDLNSELFKMHANAVTYNEPGKGLIGEAIEKHYRSMDGIAVEDYLLYGGLWQGLMLEYSLDSIRSKEHCGGAIFWMYNDCWGEVGWTIIDYYLARKIAFPFVSRAYAPTRLIIRKTDTEAIVYGINETEAEINVGVEYGYVTFDGKIRHITHEQISIKPNSREAVLRFDCDSRLDTVKGCWFVKPEGELNTAIVRSGEFSKLEIGQAQLSVTRIERINDSEAAFEVSADQYAHAVHFGFGDGVKVSDEYFDLLPHQSKRIVVKGLSADFDEHLISVKSVY